jgi:hypothetical protein
MAEVDVTAMFIEVQPLPLMTVFYLFLLSLAIIVIFEVYKVIYKKVKKVN